MTRELTRHVDALQEEVARLRAIVDALVEASDYDVQRRYRQHLRTPPHGDDSEDDHAA